MADIPPRLIEVLRELFGDAAQEVAEQLAANGVDLQELASMPGMSSPAAIRSMLTHFNATMAQGFDGPARAQLAQQVASQHITETPLAGDAQANAVAALDVAELWLDGVTQLSAATSLRTAWTPSQWLTETLNPWLKLIDPIAQKVSDGLVAAFNDGAQLRPEIAGAFGDPLTREHMVRHTGGAIFAMQVGEAAGKAAQAVLSGTELGLPLTTVRALLPAAIADFADGLEVDLPQVAMYIAVREAARCRLFSQRPWVRSHVFDAVAQYARGMSTDVDAIAEAMSTLENLTPEGVQQAIVDGLFEPAVTPAQQAALQRLETALALVEGWVDHVTAQAVNPHLPQAVRLAEMMQRRRAAGGPAEKAIASLIGIELQPRRARQAAALFAALEERGGMAARDGVWEHPDLLPTSADLDDPGNYGSTATPPEWGADLDAALADIFALKPSDPSDLAGPKPDHRAPGDSTPSDPTPDDGQRPPNSAT